jgi:hypothetical protein
VAVSADSGIHADVLRLWIYDYAGRTAIVFRRAFLLGLQAVSERQHMGDGGIARNQHGGNDV